MDGTRNIAKVCKELNCKMVYLSTDYVLTDRRRLGIRLQRLQASSMFMDRQKLEGELAVSELMTKYFHCVELHGYLGKWKELHQDHVK